MDNLDVILVASGLLQFGVAAYALRLSRIFGAVRLGWSLFGGLSLLALAYLVLSAGYRHEGGTKVDFIYALSSGSLLIGMAFLETLLKQHKKQMTALAKVNDEWPKAHDGLQQMVAQLHAEVVEQKRQTAELTKTNNELQLTAEERSATFVETKPAFAEAVKPAELEKTCRTCQDTLTKMTSDVLENASSALDQVNDSLSLVIDHLGQSRIPHVCRVAKTMREHAGNLGHFLTRDPRGRQLPDSLAQLAQHLTREQALLARQIDSAKKKIDEVRENLAAHLGKDPVSNVAAAIIANGNHALQSAYTETATDSLEPDLEIHPGGTDLEEQPNASAIAGTNGTYSDSGEARPGAIV